MVIVGFSLHVVEFRVYDSKRRIVLLPSLYPSSILSSFDGNRFFFIFYSSKDFFLFFNNNGNSWLLEFRVYDSKGRGESFFFRLYIPPPSFHPSSMATILSSTRAKISYFLIIMVIITVIVGFSLHVVEFRAYDSKGRGNRRWCSGWRWQWSIVSKSSCPPLLFSLDTGRRRQGSESVSKDIKT